MEREELVRALLKLESLGIKVRSVTTDRHPGVKSYFRKERPDVHHYFDAWHVAKGLRKKLMAAGKSRNCAAIQLWIHSIVKHLYFVAAAGEGDGNLIVSMWRSLLNHIWNRHTNYDTPFLECLHEPLLDKAWMTRGYVQELLEDVVGRASTSSHKKSSTENPPEPRKFLTDDYEAPPMEDLIATHTSKFSGGSP
ncbi:hypothetical protein HPB50_013738 [Hyalomma asiaticum]|uniref:Uncharacterized protein n=1 Tax=Hyalomma asiaticum TaxID=266040 RepID=A0ACB7SHG1_HYAAI|nr:hypothetical protein HPB50_013738 [Hyalomma asiaticum]